MNVNINVSIDGIYEVAEAIALLGSAVGAQKNMTKTFKELEKITEKVEEKKENRIKSKEEPKDQILDVTQTTVPTAIKEYTLDELSRAGAKLMDMGLMDKLVEVLNSFGVVALTDLPKNKYGDFAIKIRELGADI